MSIEIAKYQFHSWARRGISANITTVDDLGTGTATSIERAEVPIGVTINSAAPEVKNFALIGPGDIIGVNREMIIRTEPLNWITNFEPNYLSFVEFYDEDFPWRYTPASPQGEKLRPWIVLLVLKKDEFDRSKRKFPLPSIVVKSKKGLPPHADSWLWAHVHSNADIPESELSNLEKFLLSLNKTVNDDPDQIFSRLMNPRNLEANTAYTAFLVPAFEAGRLAGLDQPTEGIKAQQPSWDINTENIEMPVYFEWYFHTGEEVDFEELVKLLEPKAMDKRVGIRDMDTSQPGFIKADGTGPLHGTSPPILGLEGALKAPTTKSTVFPDPATENDFQVELEKIVNLPETVAADLTQDPIVSVPLYAKNHADTKLLDINSNTWVHDLNKDPRTRVAAGFGTLVIQKHQEKLMHKAWQQVQKIFEANRKIKDAVFNKGIAHKYVDKIFTKFDRGKFLAVTSPVMKKVMGSPTTIYHQVQESRLTTAIFSSAFRRITRPGGPVIRKISTDTNFDYNELVEQVNEGKITAAPPKEVPSGIITTKDLADKLTPPNLPKWLQWLLEQSFWILLGLLILFLALFVITGFNFIFLVLAAAMVGAYFFINNYRQKYEAAEDILDHEEVIKKINKAPQRPDFALKLEEEETAPPPTKTSGGKDSVEAANYRKALINFHQRLNIKPPEKQVIALNLQNAYSKMSAAINPSVSFTKKLSMTVLLPGNLTITKPEQIKEVMAYPDFEDPMYEKLRDISTELLIPNLHLIPNNTISLLKTNQKFIESYMVGLNHEMGSELLWREYPTDQRGSYFRQFWDVKGIVTPASQKANEEEKKKEAEEMAEKLKDIKPIHTWPKSSLLGKHNNRDAQGDAEQLVLVIRGELLKRYPNTVIFAQKAIPDPKGSAEPKIKLDLSNEEFVKHLMFPLYKAEVFPDLKFFGFDLTIEEARGTDLTDGFTDNLGWFFVIQEIPGEPRFGMDIKYDAGSDGITWDDLAWDRFNTEIDYIKPEVKPNLNPSDDINKWGTHSANMAYILFQKPNMVAVHAKEMLENVVAS